MLYFRLLIPLLLFVLCGSAEAQEFRLGKQVHEVIAGWSNESTVVDSSGQDYDLKILNAKLAELSGTLIATFDDETGESTSYSWIYSPVGDRRLGDSILTTSNVVGICSSILERVNHSLDTTFNAEIPSAPFTLFWTRDEHRVSLHCDERLRLGVVVFRRRF